MKPRITAELALAGLAVAVLLPAAGWPFVFDDLNSLHHAALTLQRPAHLLDPWMGGLWRFVPKLLLMGLLGVCGPWSLAFRALELLAHGVATWFVARAFAGLSGSRPVGLWAAGLFALGLGWYARAAVQVSNLTMVVALAFFLGGLTAQLAGRRRAAWACYALAALSHEIAWAGIVLLPPFASRVARGGAQRGAHGGAQGDAEPPLRLRQAAALAVVALAVASATPWPWRDAALTETQYLAFALLPVNADPGVVGSGLLGAVARVVVALRPMLGFGALAACVVGAMRLRGWRFFALAWGLAFFLPVAWLIAHERASWPAHWLERRYLYFPAVGLCALAGAALAAVRSPARRAAALAVVAAWSLAWDGIVLSKLARDAASPAQRAARAEYDAILRGIDPRWTLR